MKSFIVASASPRRRELMEKAGYKFEIIPSDAPEDIPGGLTVEQAVCLLAEGKALSVLKENPDAVVLGCDTVVALDGRILGKPESRDEAKEMLRFLSGREHTVVTAVCIADKDRKETFANVTAVEFYELSEATVESYAASGESDDKAGAYGIQGLGAALVKGIRGDYFSVMGLPVAQCVRVLSGFGVEGCVKF